MCLKVQNDKKQISHKHAPPPKKTKKTNKNNGLNLSMLPIHVVSTCDALLVQIRIAAFIWRYGSCGKLHVKNYSFIEFFVKCLR